MAPGLCCGEQMFLGCTILSGYSLVQLRIPCIQDIEGASLYLRWIKKKKHTHPQL